MIPPLHPRLAKIAHSVKVSAILEKLAEVHEDENVREKAAAAKVSVDTAIFGMAHFTIDTHVKTAAAENPVQHSANTMAELALGLYGFDKLSNHELVEDSPFLQEALQKIATVGAIEGLLNLVPPTISEDAVKLAAELRAINRHYGAKLLHELTEGSREKTAQRLAIRLPKKEKELGPIARAAETRGCTLQDAAKKVQDRPTAEATRPVTDYEQLDLRKLLGNR